jgi:hypothetical protein
MAVITDQNIKCYRGVGYSVYDGDSMSIVIPVVDGSDGDIDTAALGFEFQVFNGAVAALSFSEVSDEVTMGDGSITIKIPAEDTAALATNSTMSYSARLYAANDVVVTLSEGTFGVKDSYVVRATEVDVTGVTGLPDALAMAEDDVVQLAVNIAPALATDKRITWASDDVLIATVSSTGLVTAIAEGTCTITATSVSAPLVSDECALTGSA